MLKIHPNFKNILICSILLGFIYLAYLIFGGNDYYPDLTVELSDVINYAVMAVEIGGSAVVKVYSEHNLSIKEKGLTDEGKAELLTKADLVSNHLIMDLLKRYPLMNVVTEEKSEKLGEEDVAKYRDDNYSIWLNIRNAVQKVPTKKYELSRFGIYVDPLDATQEFTEDLVQYVSVMVCVTLDGKPIFGAIHRPFYNESVFGLVDYGLMDGAGNKLNVPEESAVSNTIVVSRSHAGKVKDLATKAFGDKYTVEPAGGSGYKTLRVLNGTAEFYVHTTKIKKWDICAADALIRAAGGALLDLDGQRIDYTIGTDVLTKKGLLLSAHNPFGLLTKFKTVLT